MPFPAIEQGPPIWPMQTKPFPTVLECFKYKQCREPNLYIFPSCSVNGIASTFVIEWIYHWFIQLKNIIYSFFESWFRLKPIRNEFVINWCRMNLITLFMEAQIQILFWLLQKNSIGRSSLIVGLNCISSVNR